MHSQSMGNDQFAPFASFVGDRSNEFLPQSSWRTTDSYMGTVQHQSMCLLSDDKIQFIKSVKSSDPQLARVSMQVFTASDLSGYGVFLHSEVLKSREITLDFNEKKLAKYFTPERGHFNSEFTGVNIAFNNHEDARSFIDALSKIIGRKLYISPARGSYSNL